MFMRCHSGFASLRKKGAGKGAATSFLISTPQTGVDSILVTYSMLGPVFAIFRPIAAFVSGIFGGMLVDVFDSETKPIKDETLKESTCCCHEKKEKCCEKEDRKSGIIRRVITYGFVTLMDDIAKSLLVGILLAAAISLVVPENWFASMAIGTGFTGMIVMMLFGIPLYVCATASVPIAAVLIAKGVSPGAVFVFLMTGPATNAAAIAIVWNLIGRRSALIYLGTLMVSALAFGLLLDNINVLSSGALSEACHHAPGATMYEQISATILLLLMSISLAKPLFGHSKLKE
ncbi:MAG: permease [Lentisphaerae bacterium]|nr:permease [Lentisphaerota bacterium]